MCYTSICIKRGSFKSANCALFSFLGRGICLPSAFLIPRNFYFLAEASCDWLTRTSPTSNCLNGVNRLKVESIKSTVIVLTTDKVTHSSMQPYVPTDSDLLLKPYKSHLHSRIRFGSSSMVSVRGIEPPEPSF